MEEEFEEETALDTSELDLDLGELSFDLGDLVFGDDVKPVSEVSTESVPEFIVEEPPTDVAPELEHEAANTDPAEAVAAECPMFDRGQFADVPTGLSGKVTVGTEITFGVNVPTGNGFESGWPEDDGLVLLLSMDSGTTDVVWADGSLDVLDDIGIPRSNTHPTLRHSSE